MKTLKITTDNKISIVDVDFKDFRSIQQAVGGYFETVKTSLSGRKKKRYMDLTGCQLQSMWRTRNAHVSLNR